MNDLTVRTAPTLDPYTPRDFEQTMNLARLIAETPEICPDSLRGKTGAVWLVLAKGSELGIPALAALQSIYVMKGKPVVSAHLAAALAKSSPSCVYFRCTESTAERVTYETLRKGSPESESVTWTMERARAAGLAGSPTWKKHKNEMLGARAKMELARISYPERVLGLYLPDEVAHFDAAPGPQTLESPATVPAMAPPPAPEPEAPAPVVEAEYSDDTAPNEFERIKIDLKDCADLAAWADLAAEVATHSEAELSGDERIKLRGLFSARRAELRS